jgi:hypothetical protein
MRSGGYLTVVRASRLRIVILEGGLHAEAPPGKSQIIGHRLESQEVGSAVSTVRPPNRVS